MHIHERQRGEERTKRAHAGRGEPQIPAGIIAVIIFPPGTSGGSELRLRWGLGSFSFSLPPLLGGAAVFFSFGFLWFSLVLVFFWFSFVFSGLWVFFCLLFSSEGGAP